jgi:Leucine-rich repeat (LRR) protein
MIYFAPKDRPYRDDIVQQMKDGIREIQTFYAEQMETHGYGKVTFHVETDSQGEPIVHRVDGRYPNRRYLDETDDAVYAEIGERFDLSANIYLIFVDNSINAINIGDKNFAGLGDRTGKNSGYAFIAGGFNRGLVRHELGHAFGLQHDFSSNAYIMSYGRKPNRLSACSAKFLSAHSYFNPGTSTTESPPPTIKILSSLQYPAGSGSAPVELRVSDSEGLHQVVLCVKTRGFHQAAGYMEVKACRKLRGTRDATVKFDYNGVIPSNLSTSLSHPLAHPIRIEAVDMNGNMRRTDFVLFSETLQPLSKISGDNQRGLPNTPLPIPLIVELREVHDGSARRGVPVKFTVTAGDGRLSVKRTETNKHGRAQSAFTLGPNLGTNTVEVSAGGSTVTFNAMAEAAAHIPDSNLRAVITNALEVAPGTPITPVQMETLTSLAVRETTIRDLTGLELATNLRDLELVDNGIADASVISGLTNLIKLNLGGNSISDISPLEGLTNLTALLLENNNISDISLLMENTGLGSGDSLDLRGNPLNYQSIYTYIPTLQSRGVTVEFDNRALAPLLKISGDDQHGTLGAALAQPFVVEVQDKTSTPFEGVPVRFTVTTGGGTVYPQTVLTDKNGRAEGTLTFGSEATNNTVTVSVEGGSESVTFNTIVEIGFDLSVPAGINLIHVPLEVKTVDGVAQNITTIAHLYDALGGGAKVNFLITYDSQTQEWHSYFGTSDTGTSADKVLSADTGIIAGMTVPISILLSGSPLGKNGISTITLNQGLNLVGLPLKDSRITRVSDLFALGGIRGNVPTIILTHNGVFKLVEQVDDPGDIEITGGQSFILNAQEPATIKISGEGWYNTSPIATVPPIGNTLLQSPITRIKVTNTTPVLALRGSIVNEETGLKMEGFPVTAKNLSTGRELTTVTGTDEMGYRITTVDIKTMRAATIGDILEISARSPDPYIGVAPLQYTVTTEDVRRSRIEMPALIAYEIPTKTELLANYPNPFNPETWIPYRLAEDAFVTLTIYDSSGQVVRTLNVGHRSAAVYERQSKAIYWDGKNGLGEPVASGVYFYTLTAGDYTATRKMVILK